MKRPPWKAHLQLAVTFPLRRTAAQTLPKCRSRTVLGQTPPPAGRRGDCGLRAEPAVSHSAASYRARALHRPPPPPVLAPPGPDQGPLGMFLRCGVRPELSEEKPGFRHVRAPWPAQAGPWGGRQLFPNAEFT